MSKGSNMSGSVYDANVGYKKVVLNSAAEQIQPVTPINSMSSSISDAGVANVGRSLNEIPTGVVQGNVEVVNTKAINPGSLNFYNPSVNQPNGTSASNSGGTASLGFAARVIQGGSGVSATCNPLDITTGMNVNVCAEYSNKLSDDMGQFETVHAYAHGNMECLAQEWYGSAGDAFDQLVSAITNKKEKLVQELVMHDEALATACINFEDADRILKNGINIEG